MGVCTGCSFVILPGPWFKRRMVRHLRRQEHNHDVCFLINIPRLSVGTLEKLLENVDMAGEREIQKNRELARRILGSALR